MCSVTLLIPMNPSSQTSQNPRTKYINAIHAKHVTIQPKDMFRLWHSIDSVSPIRDLMEQRQIITCAARIEAARQARGILGILSQESYYLQGTFICIL